jgi:hypothetical protein
MAACNVIGDLCQQKSYALAHGFAALAVLEFHRSERIFSLDPRTHRVERGHEDQSRGA